MLQYPARLEAPRSDRGRAAGWLLAAACAVPSTPGAAPAADDGPAAVERRVAGEDRNPFEDVMGAVQFAVPAGPGPVPRPAIQVNMAGFARVYSPVPIDAAEADVAIRAALGRRIEAAWDFQEASVREVAGRLREALGVTVVLDDRALEDAGIDQDSFTVTARLSGMTARAALRVLLAPLGLASVTTDETITITTADQARTRLTQVAYPLPRWAGFGDEAGVQSVVDLIQSTVAADTWDIVGGVGCIRVVEAAGEPLLVISQTGDVHDAVERLLRAIHGRTLAEFEAGTPVLKVHPVADAVARADLVERLKDLCNATLGADAEPDAEVTAVAATIVVRSTSPRFHALAAQVIAAVGGHARRGAPPGEAEDPFAE